MGTLNPHLTATNEKRVMELIQNFEVKRLWQHVAYVRGKAAADTCMSNRCGVPLSTIKAARYYWG